VITVGVDLAAEPKNTAVARLEWANGECRVLELSVMQSDDDVVNAVVTSDKAGLDCPLGWPDAFIEFVTVHQTGHVSVGPGLDGRAWRRTLANRLTDLAVHEHPDLKLTPLSVSTDRIAHPAMRAAGLLARLAAAGQAVDRAGAGVVVEVYPAASLKLCGLGHRGYKGANQAELASLAEALVTACDPWLRLGRHREAFTTSDHCFDAVVAALTARAAATGRTPPVPSQHAEAAGREGWIALPVHGSLTELHRDVPG
jgi:predicted nuclease with RNAse H fold